MTYAIPAWDVPAVPIAGSRDVFPVRHIYCVGRNYAEHAKEMGGDATKEPPFFFTKPADAIVAGRAARGRKHPLSACDEELPPRDRAGRRDRQGRRERRAERANELVFGYAVGLDMTRRDLQNDMREKKRPWDIGKSFAQAAPIAPIHPVAQTGISRSGAIRLDVNGARRQQGDLADMIWDVPHTLAFLSHVLRAAARRPDLHRHARRRRRGGRGRPARRPHRRPDAAVDRHRATGRMTGTPPTRPSSSSAATTIARRFPTIRSSSRSTPSARRPRSRRYAPQARPALRAESAGNARSLPAGGHAARHVRLHPWRLLARARQGRFLVRRRAIRRARLRGGGGQLRPVSGGHDRDDRRRMPASLALARARRRRVTVRLRRHWSSAGIPRAATWPR